MSLTTEHYPEPIWPDNLGAAPPPSPQPITGVRKEHPMPAPDDHFLSLVLPAHNEEGNLDWVVREALAALPLTFVLCEIIIVDDGSADATPAIAARLSADDPRVRVIRHPQNRGYGAALRSGFAAARGDRIMFMDSDRQFNIREVAKLAPLVGRYDIVAGYRLKRRDPLRRVALGASFNVLVKVLFGVRVRDIDCGFKIFRADLLRSLDLQAPGALINTEILALARRQQATVIEIGVNHYPRPTGEQSGGSPRVVLRALGETLRLWLRLRHDTGAVQAERAALIGRTTEPREQPG